MGSNRNLKGKEKEPVTLVGLQGETIMEVLSVQSGRDGDGIDIKCKILGVMTYTVCLKSEETEKIIGLINWPIVKYVLKNALRMRTVMAIIRKLSFWRKQ